jgi:hypothetical protein
MLTLKQIAKVARLMEQTSGPPEPFPVLRTAKHLVVVTCEESGHQGLYVNGTLVDQDSTIYACDIAEHSKDGPIDFSHVTVVMPKDVDTYPEKFEACMLWIPTESV